MENTFGKNVGSLMEGLKGFINSETVVGEPIHIDNTIILPLVDVSFGLGTGANEGKKEKGNNSMGAGALGAKISPSAVLVITDGHARLVNIKNQDSLTKLLDLVPDVMERFNIKNKNINVGAEDINKVKPEDVEVE